MAMYAREARASSTLYRKAPLPLAREGAGEGDQLARFARFATMETMPISPIDFPMDSSRPKIL